MALKKIFFRLLIFLFVLATVDYFLGKILRKLYFSQTSGIQYRITVSLEKTKADILVFGSSRAVYHYCSDIFSRNLNMSYYNVGHEGVGIIYHYTVLKSILNRSTPKIIILDINKNEFEQNLGSYDRISIFLPYYKTHPEIRDIILSKSPIEKYKLLSNVYPYNSMIVTMILGNSSLAKDELDFNGYIPLKAGDSTYLKKQLLNPESKTISSYRIDSFKINIFKDFIRLCTEKKIKLCVSVSPYLRNAPLNDLSLSLADSICKLENVQFLNFSYCENISDKTPYFKDFNHLSKKGSQEFSKLFVDSLKSLYTAKKIY